MYRAKGKIFIEARERYWASLYLDISLAYKGSDQYAAQCQFRRALYQYVPMNKRDEVVHSIRSFIEKMKAEPIRPKGGG